MYAGHCLFPGGSLQPTQKAVSAMFKVLTCLAVDHDWRLVALAALICLVASVTAISLFTRARASRGRVRMAWIATAAVAGGCGIWATHFIAMLAYTPDVTVGYGVALTLLSLVAAIVITGLGLWIALEADARFAAPLGGAIVGAGVAVMHFTGMWALEVPGRVTWDGSLVIASIVFGIVFGAAAIGVAVRGDDSRHMAAASLLLMLAILLHHFTAMGAAEIVPDPTRMVDEFSLSPTILALAVANAALAILFMSLAGAFADRRVRDKERQLATAVNNMAQGVVMFDGDQRLVVCNDRYLEMYDLSPNVVKPGCTLGEVIDERLKKKGLKRDPDNYREELLSAMSAGTTLSATVEYEDGRVIYIVNRPIGNGFWVGTHDDITDRKRTERLIAHMAHHDSLTDLPNRAAFAAQLQKSLDLAARDNGSFALLCIDLDRFKEVNDVFGHQTGDGLLREVGERLRAAGESAFLARLGGDEFTLISTGGPQPATAEALAERLLAALSGDVEVDGQLLRVGLSVGVAIYPVDGADGQTLQANADAALYRAKAEGRGLVRFFQPSMDESLRERRALQHDLRSALARNELYLDYQPQADIAGNITGFEALARWRHPTRGLVAPATFIPIAEESGLIIPIGEWIMREACREAVSWPNPLQIAVNLSPVQFRHGDLPGLVHGILLETGLKSSRLELEITEGVLISNYSQGISILGRLKALGARIAMDDFGTGYSSLSYLQAFPFDKIKIDRAFVSNLEQRAQSAAIIRAVIGLGRGLNLPVVAEGVETAAQLSFLSEEGCTGVQGYLIGRPGPIAAFDKVVGRTTQRRAVRVSA
jgi:diguanylate cyclase (GGDEF)-like protein